MPFKTIETTITDPKRRFLCRHIFTDGHRCGSPALRSQHFCYYHDISRRDVALAGRIGIFTMPRFTDRPAVQNALYEVLARVAAGDLELKRANTLLYGLQIASSNLAREIQSVQPGAQAQSKVEAFITDRDYGDLAPIVEVPEAVEPPQNCPQRSEQREVEEPALNLSKEPAVTPNTAATDSAILTDTASRYPDDLSSGLSSPPEEGLSTPGVPPPESFNFTDEQAPVQPVFNSLKPMKQTIWEPAEDLLSNPDPLPDPDSESASENVIPPLPQPLELADIHAAGAGLRVPHPVTAFWRQDGDGGSRLAAPADSLTC